MIKVMPEVKRSRKRITLIFFIVLLSFILPFWFIILGIFIFRKTNVTTNIPENEAQEREVVTPDELLKDKFSFHNKKITLRGRVYKESVVCEKGNCPEEDPCCGCPEDRDLIISEPKSFLNFKTEGKLKLLSSDGISFCQREAFSCEYSCGDWEDGSIYNITGDFFAQAPPPGWKSSLSYYFQVESKELVKGFGFKDALTNFFSEIKDKLLSLKNTNSFVLP